MVDGTYKSSSTLFKQFVRRMLIVLLVILGVSGIVQYYYLDTVTSSNVKQEASKVSVSISQGITETNTASNAIEHQIDLKLMVVAKRISDRLGNQPLNTITNTELDKISKEYGTSGLTIFVKRGNDVVGVKSTAPSDVGFSFKKVLGVNNPSLLALEGLFQGKTPPAIPQESYANSNTLILKIGPSGSNNSGVPVFYKYGYYHASGKNYLINPFIKADEVYQFTKSVGPDSWIKTVLSTHKDVKEVAVLNPQVYADPSLLKSKYSMLKKVVYGSFSTETPKDDSVIASMSKHRHKVSYIEKQNGVSYYKMFIPTKDGQVIYVALNYGMMSSPLRDMSWILICFSLLSLLVLFILTTRFFGVIYKNIQVIITQIKKLELGDFTARSEVKAKGELADLSASTNRMAETLSGVLKDTTKQAEKVQHLAKTLKSDTDESVEKVYALSIDLTSKARDDNFEISDFLDRLSDVASHIEDDSVKQEILDKIDTIRTISDNRSESTTDITLTLSDVIKSLQAQSVELSDISSSLFDSMDKFNVNKGV